MLIVVGGHTRNIGKTSVVAGIIEALPEREWTAMKITQFGHGVCSNSGAPCECSLAPECRFAISEESCPSGTDTGRFLAAGARHSYWVRTAMGEIETALPAVREVLAHSHNVIVESNSIVEHVKPDLYLVVLDFGQTDFKPSSRRFLERADGCVVIDRTGGSPAWQDVASATWDGKPRFAARPPQYVTAELAAFVRTRSLDVAAESW